jgi:hypothetical protein
MSEQLTTQQHLTLDMLWRKHDARNARKHLDHKATILRLAASSSLTGAVSIRPSPVNPSPWLLAGWPFSSPLARHDPLRPVGCPLRLHPGRQPTGTPSTTTTSRSADNCYAQVLSNLLDTPPTTACNERKARYVAWGAGSLPSRCWASPLCPHRPLDVMFYRKTSMTGVYTELRRFYR